MPLSVPAASIDERFVRATGPGGQNVNKVATAVELRFDPRVGGLSEPVRARLAAIAGSRMTDDGILVIQAREFRTQAANREAARERLEELLQRAARPPRARRPTKPTRAAKERRLEEKTHRAAVKRDRRRREGE